MITIVVYSSDKTFIDKNIECLNLFVSNYDDCCMYKFNCYNEKLESFIIDDKLDNKIYILDISSDKLSGIKLALKIREFDYRSIIILVNSACKCNEDISNTRLMVLDFICISENYNDRLIDDMHIAVSILNKNSLIKKKNNILTDKIFTFKYRRIVYRIPFGDIMYIEKESNIKRCIIHTINRKYYITDSLNSILSQLDDNFCRTHQSCIINLNNIKKIELGSNMVIFKNGDRTDMVTCKTKKDIKKYIGVS